MGGLTLAIPSPMKLLSAGLGLLLVLVLAGLYLQHRHLSAVEIELAAMNRDREAAQAEMRKLQRQLGELQSRTATNSPKSETARASTSGDLGRGTVAEDAPPPQPAPRPGVTVGAPVGWHKNGAKPDFYAVGVDSTQTWGGMPSAYVESLAPTVEKGFGGMMQTTAAENYAGKRVRLSGWVKTQDANEGGGHLWLRIDGQERGQMLGFDNMDNRPVKGTTDWQEASIVLEVPEGASSLNYGFFVSGGGKMWVSGQNIEVVGPDVPTTNMLKKRPSLPNVPRNLGFSPQAPK